MDVKVQSEIVVHLTREEASQLNQAIADAAHPDGGIFSLLGRGLAQALDDTHS